MVGGDRRQEAALADLAGIDVTGFAHEMLHIGRQPKQTFEPEHRIGAVLGRHEIRVFGGQFGVLFGRDEPLGSHQVVVQELTIAKSAADLAEEHADLGIGEFPPTRQRDLKPANAQRAAEIDPLDHRRQRQADDADHRLGAPGTHRLVKDPGNLLELAVADGIPLARRAEDVQVRRQLQHAPHLIDEQRLDEFAPLVPGNHARAHDACRKSLHVVLYCITNRTATFLPDRWEPAPAPPRSPARASCSDRAPDG